MENKVRDQNLSQAHMLKPLDQVLLPDPRYASLVIVDPEQGVRPLTLADHHAFVATISISEQAPAEVRTMFARACHAFLYAWFDYELSALAEHQAFATLELALRLRLGKKGTLKPLAQYAVTQGLFSPMLGAFPLPFLLSQMRNHWAHGSANLTMPGMTRDALEICAELIDRLYPSDCPVET